MSGDYRRFEESGGGDSCDRNVNDIPNDAFQKVDSDRHLVVDGEDALTVSLDHRRLADCSVAHDHDLKQGTTRVSQQMNGRECFITLSEVSKSSSLMSAGECDRGCEQVDEREMEEEVGGEDASSYRREW